MNRVGLRTMGGLVLAAGLAGCNLPEANAAQTVAAPALAVTLSADTEYYAAPSAGSGAVGVLKAGQQITVVGRSPEGEFLVFLDPANPAASWWIKTEAVADVAGLSALPLSSIPGPPTPPAGLADTCPTPVGGGPTPVSCVTPVAGAETGGCPTPIGGGPTPVYCGPALEQPSGCPTPIGGGPTPVYCGPVVEQETGGCPTPVGGGPTPVYCGPAIEQETGGCPTPVGAGPTPVSCVQESAPAAGRRINPLASPTPIGGGWLPPGSFVPRVLPTSPG